MKNLFIHLLLYCGFCFNLNAQSLFPPTKLPIDREKVRQYYDHIYKAESLIINQHLDSALENYEAAFQLKYPNGQDLYNAFLTAFYTNHRATAKSMMNELAFKGFSKGGFADSFSNPELYNYVMTQHDSFYNIGKNSEMFRLSLLFDTIMVKDQEIRNKYDSAAQLPGMEHIVIQRDSLHNDSIISRERVIAKDATGDPNPDGATVFYNDSMNLVRLKDYFLTYGYPSFEQIGFWNHHIMRNRLSTPVFILFHFRPMPTSIDSFFVNAVLDGKLPPEQWATLKMGSIEDDPYHMRVWNEKVKLDAVQKVALNKKRAEIYLPKLAEYNQIWLFSRVVYLKSQTEYNPNIYGKGYQQKLNFMFLNTFLIPSDFEIEHDITF